MEWSLQNLGWSSVGVTSRGGTRRPPVFVRLTIRGRKTGRPHTTRVAVLQSKGRHWVVDLKPDAALTEFVVAARQHAVFNLREAPRVALPTAATPSATGGHQ